MSIFELGHSFINHHRWASFRVEDATVTVPIMECVKCGLEAVANHPKLPELVQDHRSCDDRVAAEVLES